jgi:hypothetical protein
MACETYHGVDFEVERFGVDWVYSFSIGGEVRCEAIRGASELIAIRKIWTLIESGIGLTSQQRPTS